MEESVEDKEITCKFNIHFVGIEFILIQTLEILDVNTENLVFIVPRPLLQLRMTNMSTKFSSGKSINLSSNVGEILVKNLWNENQSVNTFSNILSFDSSNEKNSVLELKAFIPGDEKAPKSIHVKVSPMNLCVSPELLRQLNVFLNSLTNSSDKNDNKQKIDSQSEEIDFSGTNWTINFEPIKILIPYDNKGYFPINFYLPFFLFIFIFPFIC